MLKDEDTITFTSTSLVSAPGYADYLAHAYKSDQRWAFEALCAAQPLMPMWAAEKLLKGDYIVGNESITLIKENKNEGEYENKNEEEYIGEADDENESIILIKENENE